jgi:nitrate/nitrite-specific signal transduction histidine kinase
MKERAKSIQSRLVIESKPGKGTQITLGIPLASFQIAVEEGEKVESIDS